MVAREGASRLYHGSPGRSVGAQREANPDHIPQLARVGGWMVRIGGAGMLFVIAGCCGWASLLTMIVPADMDEQQELTLGKLVGTGLTMLFALTFLTFVVGVGLKILAGERDRV